MLFISSVVHRIFALRVLYKISCTICALHKNSYAVRVLHIQHALCTKFVQFAYCVQIQFRVLHMVDTVRMYTWTLSNPTQFAWGKILPDKENVGLQNLFITRVYFCCNKNVSERVDCMYTR